MHAIMKPVVIVRIYVTSGRYPRINGQGNKKGCLRYSWNPHSALLGPLIYNLAEANCLQ
jgi:hypothetical protein